MEKIINSLSHNIKSITMRNNDKIHKTCMSPTKNICFNSFNQTTSFMDILGSKNCSKCIWAAKTHS